MTGTADPKEPNKGKDEHVPLTMAKVRGAIDAISYAVSWQPFEQIGDDGGNYEPNWVPHMRSLDALIN